MIKTKVTTSETFACAECNDDIDNCDGCKERFDYLDQLIYCGAEEHIWEHFCEDCHRKKKRS